MTQLLACLKSTPLAYFKDTEKTTSCFNVQGRCADFDHTYVYFFLSSVLIKNMTDIFHVQFIVVTP